MNLDGHANKVLVRMGHDSIKIRNVRKLTVTHPTPPVVLVTYMACIKENEA